MYNKQEELTEALIRGDYFKSWDILYSHIKDGYNSTFIFDSLLKQSMYDIGKLWEKNKITVADEHLATSVCDFLVTRYSYDYLNIEDNIEDREKPRALFFCLENEEHYLGLKMVASLFKEHHWDVKFLGPNLPLEYAIYSARKWSPEVIGLSLSITHLIPRLSEYISNLEKLDHNPKILVGGRLTTQYDLRPYCSEQTIILKEMNEVHQFLQAYKKEEEVGVSRSV